MGDRTGSAVLPAVLSPGLHARRRLASGSACFLIVPDLDVMFTRGNLELVWSEQIEDDLAASSRLLVSR